MARKDPSQLAKAKTPTVKATDAYHHGDLRSALIAAAREALETSTPEEITLKSLAVRLGVSQPAPYRHFSSREALLAAVAADGFERFRAALETAADAAPQGQGFFTSAMAYVGFGRANPGVYRLMFASSIMSAVDDEALGKAGKAAFELLVQRVTKEAPAERVYPIAVMIWSTLHGLVMLESRGLFDSDVAHHTRAEDVVRQMAAMFG